jgi:very-short-patch-repair endonuclease
MREVKVPVKNIVVGQKVTAAKAQRARELRRDMTPEETVIWQAVRRNQLGGCHFRRQQVISGFIADFYCHAAGLVVEIDGEIHQTRTQYDDDRDRVLKARGLRVLRIPNTLVRRGLQAALALVLAACQEANTSSPSETTLGDETLPRSLLGKGPGDRS